ncbi:MAG: EAL domain-containing protein [bacterium]
MQSHTPSAAQLRPHQPPIASANAASANFQHKGLASALERYDDTLKQLFCALAPLEQSHNAQAEDIRGIYLRALSQVSGNNSVGQYKDRSLIALQEMDRPGLLHQVFSEVIREQSHLLSLAPDAAILTPGQPGSSYFPQVALLPMHSEEASGVIILETGDGLQIDEVIYFTLKKIYDLSERFTRTVPLARLKAQVYDLFKQRYQYVSQYVYDQRFALFQQEIQSIEMHFEPIYSFDNVHQSEIIYAWEALARQPKTSSAPISILMAAELWGTRFKTELDIYVLEASISTYCEEARRAKVSRQNEIRPLSINLYPDTLFRPAYHAKLEELLKQRRLIRGSNLILEISEKSIIKEHGEGDTLEQFLHHMEALRKQYGLAFAIDDFGAGYSSIVRLNALKPEWVKIDREVLHCEPMFAKSQIKNLLDIETEWARPAFRIIIEGLDTDSRISLDELLNDVGVEYIQGYLLGKAQPTIIERAEEAHGESIRACAGWLAHPQS